MEQARQSIIDRLNQANNILVTVSNNPTVDQLSACVGLTLLLNKLNKHGTAVFSGAVPPALEFLQPSKTIEKNTDSLRDFIIALDKSKADKLKYKVEDKAVKIFITPYRSSISEADLDFSQGDFNVEVVVALGVHERKDLDEAITVHGRILHDATVICINLNSSSELGSLNLTDTTASSLSEVLVGLGTALKPDVLDEQISNAFLTGIVAETDRFSNEKTTSTTMEISAKLMAAGANQQLVVNKLEEAMRSTASPVQSQPDDSSSNNEDTDSATEAEVTSDGSLVIVHNKDEEEGEDSEPEEDNLPAVEDPGTDEQDSDNKSDDSEQEELPEQSELPDQSEFQEPEIGSLPRKDYSQTTLSRSGGSHVVTDPPSLGGVLTANSRPEALDPVTDPMSTSSKDMPLLTHDTTQASNEDVKLPDLPELPDFPDGPTAQQPAPVPPPPSVQQPPTVEQPPAAAPADEYKPPAPPPPEPLAPDNTADTPTKDNAQASVPASDPTATEAPAEVPEESRPPTSEEARNAVEEAMRATDNPPLKPLEALNAETPFEIEHGDGGPLAQAPSIDSELKTNDSNINIDPGTGEIKFPDESGQNNTPPPVPPPMPMMPPPPPAAQPNGTSQPPQQ
ncbi:hypothetical protein BH23PAT1_BH23PAT1_0510 [soil metagenome]